MGTMFFRNGEFVKPVITEEIIEYRIHETYAEKVIDGKIVARITIEEMLDEVSSSDTIQSLEIKNQDDKRFKEGILEILKDAPKEFRNMIRFFD